MNPDTAEKTADINLLEEEDLSMEGYDKPVKRQKTFYLQLQQYNLSEFISLFSNLVWREQ